MLAKHVLILGLVYVLAGCGTQLNPDFSVVSPDSRIVFTVMTDGLGRVYYHVVVDGETTIEPSRLGFTFANAEPFLAGLSVQEVSRDERDDTWEQPWGERRFVRSHYNESMLDITDGERHVGLRVRVFDDGLGFRYEFGDDFNTGELLITDELTQFNLADHDSLVHWTEAFNEERYEYQYNDGKIADIDVAHTPLTAKLSNHRYVTLHEAALVDYSSLVLRRGSADTLNTELVAAYDGIKVRREGPFTTPWRTVQIADSSVDLLRSNLILNLNEPNKLGDVSWLKPGIYMGIWWSLHTGEQSWEQGPKLGATTEEAKRYIDFISTHGLDGFLVEGWNVGWTKDWWKSKENTFSFTESNPRFDLEEVARYARDKQVSLILHNETAGDVEHYEEQMAAAFALYERLGVQQLKTGYVDFANGYTRPLSSKGGREFKYAYEWNHGQYVINHMQRSIEKAAEHKIAINMHESIKPTGLRRTYPNFMTRESAMGQEYKGFAPRHTTVLPFTRMMAGPFDYTPGIFNLWYKGEGNSERIKSTIAKQLGLMVVLYSPMQMAADLPRFYEQKPDLFQFIKEVPADWEESIPLGGEIGEYVVYARQQRGTESWFVGGITNEVGRTFELDFDFLGDGEYTARIYKDGADADWDTNPYSTVIESIAIKSATVLPIYLAPGGGFAISITKNSNDEGSL